MFAREIWMTKYFDVEMKIKTFWIRIRRTIWIFREKQDHFMLKPRENFIKANPISFEFMPKIF